MAFILRLSLEFLINHIKNRQNGRSIGSQFWLQYPRDIANACMRYDEFSGYPHEDPRGRPGGSTTEVDSRRSPTGLRRGKAAMKRRAPERARPHSLLESTGQSLISRLFGRILRVLSEARLVAQARKLDGGRGGIRTPDTLSGKPVFKTGAINHSATLPQTS